MNDKLIISKNTDNIHRNYGPCISILRRLSNVECLTLILAIGVNGTISNHFIDGFILEKNIVSYMPRLSQFNFHIRSILKNASHITIEQIRQSFPKININFPHLAVLILFDIHIDYAKQFLIELAINKDILT